MLTFTLLRNQYFWFFRKNDVNLFDDLGLRKHRNLVPSSEVPAPKTTMALCLIFLLISMASEDDRSGVSNKKILNFNQQIINLRNHFFTYLHNIYCGVRPVSEPKMPMTLCRFFHIRTVSEDDKSVI